MINGYRGKRWTWKSKEATLKIGSDNKHGIKKVRKTCRALHCIHSLVLYIIINNKKRGKTYIVAAKYEKKMKESLLHVYVFL